MRTIRIDFHPDFLEVSHMRDVGSYDCGLLDRIRKLMRYKFVLGNNDAPC